MKRIKKLNIEKPYLVYLEWMDAVASSRWMKYDEVLEWVNANLVPIKEVGWLLHQDDTCIVLGSRRHDYEDGTIFEVGQIEWIPRAWVVKLKRIVL